MRATRRRLSRYPRPEAGNFVLMRWVVSEGKRGGGQVGYRESIVASMDQSRSSSAADMHVGCTRMRGGKFPWLRVHRQAKDLVAAPNAQKPALAFPAEMAVAVVRQTHLCPPGCQRASKRRMHRSSGAHWPTLRHQIGRAVAGIRPATDTQPRNCNIDCLRA
jgi:hypothetical protein